ncbi:pyridoxamine 5'-phosphate oxidase family protein [Nocardia sp. NBC_00508]|uniref:pyridoxamine 5'-phosphate oxidase family protein n=1 Tax=Nocardia sp. NBC_00508 TaxID=2975992 RepID=UPI002E809221|nr:pyridoxamine 5'-phosphate oxidase family protein [Nocardia sp. NBC_00508]WUD67281.1 pyridoxamine 5'-phosphate oxidase family protein [Nocardia sp. NBC_00508]
MAVTWPDEVDEVLRGDLTCAVAYVTPAGGAVVSAVSPIGLRDRTAGTVGFTTSLGFGRKLERMKRDPRVALAYHAREHGIGDLGNPRFVLVQGTASFDPTPDQDALDRIGDQSVPYLGRPRRGVFWDRWLHAYYADRVLVTVMVERIVVWPDLDAAGTPEIFGAASPSVEPEPQRPPAKGAGARVDVAKTAARVAELPHRLLAYRQADGYPAVVPVQVAGSSDRRAHAGGGIVMTVPAGVPQGGRRAGLLAHAYRPQLIGLESRQCTGWLEVSGTAAVYAPHTAAGFKAPPNKTILLLANGFLARRGLARARKTGRAEAVR